MVNSIQNDNNFQKGLVLYGANLIDGTDSQVKYNVTVIVNQSKIIDITDKNNVVNSKDYFENRSNVHLVNVTGKYIIPGLFDMHAHVAGVYKNSFNQTFSEEMLHMLLSQGVTTIRSPGGPTEQSTGLKENISLGRIKGPQMFTAGQLLNSPNASIPFVEEKVLTEEDVRKEVNRQANLGVDFVKLYVGLTPNLVAAAIDEAHSLGIKTIGHLYTTSWTDAANMDIDYLTHGIPVNPYLLSSDNRRIFEVNGGSYFNHFLWLNLVDLDGKEINEMMDALVENNVYVDPTLSIYEAMIKDNPQKQQLWNKVLKITKKMYVSDVKILAGTDIPNFELIAGESLHHELELLEDAGIPESEVIKIATRNGAESLGILNQTGTIEKGKDADMIILSSNPIDDISNIKEIEAVISDGKVIDK